MVDLQQQVRLPIQHTKAEYFHFLVDLTDRIILAHDIPELLKNTSDFLNDFFGLDFVCLEIPLLASCSLCAHYVIYDGHHVQHYDCSTPPLHDSLLEEVLEKHEKIVLDQSKLQSYSYRLRHQKQFPLEKLLSLLDLPLIANGKIIGLLAIGSFKQNYFSSDVMDVLEKVSNRIALAMQTLLMNEEQSATVFADSNSNITLDTHIPEDGSPYNLIGKSQAIQSILSQIEIVAHSNATVLLLGETGTGKGHIAQIIHNLSDRKDREMVRMNCTAIPSELMENELFGHERGAFTGAQTRSIGHFERADHSTLFLDEIGDMPIELQPKLLSVLQENQIRRLGGSDVIPLDVRFIAATNNNLIQKIQEKTFRSDLYYRLNVFPITVPPLRERIADIPLLVKHFTTQFAQKNGRHITEIPADSLAMMSRMPWYGNIRELENVVERAVIMTSEGNVLNLTPDFLSSYASRERPQPIMGIPAQTPVHFIAEPEPRLPLPETDRETLIDALIACDGVIGGKKGTAARLGLKRTTLLARLKKHGITPDDYRPQKD